MRDIDFTRRRLLHVLGQAGIAAALPFTGVWAATAASARLSFLAVGDWGRHGNDHQRAVASRMGESAARLGARFVISVGDNFYENGVSGVDDPAWRSSFEDVYAAPSLQVPWHVALGNHDYRGNVQAQLDYSRGSRRWRMPGRWFSFTDTAADGTQLEVFVLDTSPMIRAYYAHGARVVKVGDQADNVPVQLAWLDAGLAASKADWKIVVGHHPIYMGRPRHRLFDSAPDRQLRMSGGAPELMAQLDPILQRHRVALYLNGHIHELQHVHHGATHYICTGAGSKVANYCDEGGGADFCSLNSGFIACTLARSWLRVAYRDYRGAQLHVVDIARPT